MNELNIQTLVDRAAISDVFNNYAAGVDQRDWQLFRSCFTDDVEADFTGVLPGNICYGADSWVAAVAKLIEPLAATQHIITNHSHDINGDSAKCRSYLQAQHMRINAEGEQEQYLIGGYYDYDMVRIDQVWKIKKYSLTQTWCSGDPSVLIAGGTVKRAAG